MNAELIGWIQYIGNCLFSYGLGTAAVYWTISKIRKR